MDLKGKKIAFLGDSITEGVGVENQELRYDRRMAEKYGIEAVNFGISGTRLAHQRTASEKPRYDLCFCGRAYDLPKDSDIIVVFGGTNDYGHGDAPLGTFADRTPYTFYGACHLLMQALLEKFSDSLIVFMTPLHRCAEHRLLDGIPSEKTEDCLENFVNALQEVAAYYSLPVLDLYRCSGIQPEVEIIREKYCPDGLHPNDAGHVLLASRLQGFLEAL